MKKELRLVVSKAGDLPARGKWEPFLAEKRDGDWRTACSCGCSGGCRVCPLGTSSYGCVDGSAGCMKGFESREEAAVWCAASGIEAWEAVWRPDLNAWTEMRRLS